MKEINTVVEDIYALFDPEVPHEVDESNLEHFAETVKNVLRTRLAERKNDPTLRFSNLGRPDRQVWMSHHPSDLDEKLTSKTLYKFLYGDIIEALVLFLAAEAGHEVTHQQEEIEVDGVKGHIDAIIDGTLVDVKSASTYGFKKFKQNTVVEDDPFGYVAQLAGYGTVLTPGKAPAWLAMDKSSASLCLTPLSTSVVKDHDPAPRIAHLKEVIQQDEPPSLCHEPLPDGKSGNLRLSTPCGYCAFKRRCFPELRTFLYSTGPRYLSRVIKVPDVPELIEGTGDDPVFTD